MRITAAGLFDGEKQWQRAHDLISHRSGPCLRCRGCRGTPGLTPGSGEVTVGEGEVAFVVANVFRSAARRSREQVRE